MVAITGYTILGQISAGERSLVLRARRESDGLAVVLKMPTSNALPLREILRYQHEYRLLASLNLSQVIRVHALLPHEEGFILVEEDFSACDLGQFLQDRTLHLSEFFPLARQMAQGLAQVHRNNIIHKDLHLGNVLVDPASGMVKLSDFGQSSLFESEMPEALGAGMLEGALAYMAPEQTGRTKHPVDYRCDLYALGVCFYRMLTGSLPFTSTDPLELIHSHIARQPVAPHTRVPDVPQSLSQLVLKLLAKEPEQRYQSAQGVLHDLKVLQAAWALGDVRDGYDGRDDFVPGQADVSPRFQVARKLYGREAQTAQLLSAFEHVTTSAVPEMVLVAGYSGVGKTALVHEVHLELARRRGRFVRGKFDQYQRDIPFSALLAAFNQLLHQILAESEAQLAAWRQALGEALGNNARVITDVLPELGIVLGAQAVAAALDELAPQETKNRFLLTFQRFVGVFAKPEHPLVLFLDDLQWADVPSLHLLEKLCTGSKGVALLLLGAYRDNEVQAGHPLMEMLRHQDEAGGAGMVVTRIDLMPLGLQDIEQLLCDTLGQENAATHALAQLLQQKTGGNPFFLIQTLNALYRDGLFVARTNHPGWDWELERMQSLQLCDNVVDLLVQRIGRLSLRTQRLLQLAACIGNPFSLKVLATIDEKTESETGADLWEALREGLIQSSGDGFRFLHDRVQQAAYSLIASAELGPLHLKTGRLLVAGDPDALSDTGIFDVLAHFNQALDLITEAPERAFLADLNGRAGQRAKRATAYTAALRYFQIALALLPSNSWQADYSLSLALHTEALSAAFFTGDYALMEVYGAAVLAHARSVVDRVGVYKARSDVFVSQKRNRDAIFTVLPILVELGVVFPKNPGNEDIEAALDHTASRLALLPVEQLLDLPPMEDASQRAALEILVAISAPCYQSFPVLFPLVVCKQVNISLDFGNADISAFGYMTYAMILSGLLQDYDLAVRFGQMAIDLAKKRQARQVCSKIVFLFNNNIRHHKVPLTDTLADLLESARLNLELGDPEYACLTRLSYLQHLFYAGMPLDKVQAEMDFAAALMHSVKQEIALRFTNIHRQTVYRLVRPSDAPWVLHGDVFDASTAIPAHDTITLYVLHSSKVMLEFLFYRYEEAAQSARSAIETLSAAIGLAGVPIVHFYHCLAQLAMLSRVASEQRQQVWDVIDISQNQLKLWSGHCKANFLHKWHLVEAERQRCQGNPWQAVQQYEAAIATAKTHGFIHEQALACELAANFWLAQDKLLPARAYLSEAHRLYRRWGASAKVQHLEQTHSYLRTTTYPMHPMDSSSQRMTHERLDLLSVLKAAQAISSAIHLDELLRTMLRIVLENAGAEEGFLLLETAGDWGIAARVQAVDQSMHFEKSALAGSAWVCEAMVRLVLRTRRELVLDDASQDSLFQNEPHVRSRGSKSVLCLPLMAQNRLNGVLYLENRLTAGAFATGYSQILKMLSAQAAIALENALLYQSLETKVQERTQELAQANAHLHRLSLTDALTGIANRRHFDEALQTEWRRAARSGQMLALAMIDVDWFKRYNDHYGHQRGDACLKAVAQVLGSCSRRVADLVARYGGEEFAFIAPETERGAMQAVAEEIRRAVEAMAMAHSQSLFGHVTVSIGVACMVPAPHLGPENLIQAADAALYRAKEAGRNQVVCV
ncbi:MAG: diguanylate cyclase [Rhodoferax sp.]|nr:diguanylate cyclase [Rhodoferax sp.]